MGDEFSVGLTRDFLADDGRLAFKDIGLDLLDQTPGVKYEFFDDYKEVVTADQIAGYDAVISYLPAWTPQTFVGSKKLSVLARFGVGYDMVDVAACTDHDVVLAITPDGVRRPLAEGTVTLILAAAKEIFPKSKILREGRWMDHKFIYGSCMIDKVIGTIGLGNIAQDVMKLLAPFDLAERLAFDPYCPKEKADELGVKLVDLDTLLKNADFVCVNCLLNDETRGLMGPREFGLMKESAYLINTARGPIVNTAALIEALRSNQIRGAALDVFEVEPIESNDPLLELDNCITLPHAVGWTDEALLGNGRGACKAVLNVFQGQSPEYVVNRDVLAKADFKQKLSRYRSVK